MRELTVEQKRELIKDVNQAINDKKKELKI